MVISNILFFFTGEEFKGSYIGYAKSGLMAVLEAKMNINIEKIDNESTKISINTNYKYLNTTCTWVL